MGDTALELVSTVMTSPWLYVLLVGLAVLDAFLPLVPSEAAVLLAGTFAAGHGPDLALVVVAGAAGAVAGDHVAYAVGRALGTRVLSRVRPGTRTARAHAWAAGATARAGGPVLVGARFVPGGRTATTLTMGATGFPVRRFAAYDSVACVLWASWCSGVGYVGGRVFADHPFVGAAAGTVLALLVGLVAALAHRRSTAR